MGLDQSVTFPVGVRPSYPALAELLARHSFPVQMRMIDGQLAFPDEAPPDDWRELRLATPQGMVTVRREPGRLTCVTWGNADASLLQAWNAVTWALAEATGGQVEAPSGAVSAAEFRMRADLPPAMKST
ncbi:MAG: hypothetical protein JNM56_19450 [Planctomycetia bacterium]|nr:hypothetical protein [Planctomycetia bacterium]